MRTIFSNQSEQFTFIFDLDGVIYRGWEPQPSAIETLHLLKDMGHFVRFYTNNSASSRNSYSTKMSKLGFPTPPEEIMTTSYATAFYLIEQGAVGKTVLRIGGDGIREELEAVGMHCIAGDQEPDAQPEFVVVGIDREFTYAKLARAQHAIFDGARFIATNRDSSFPIENDVIMPGAGCIVAAVQTSCGVAPYVIGKPETYAFNKILESTGSDAAHAVMVGDRLDTDILVAKNAGARSVLVLTGVNNRTDAEEAPDELKPDFVMETLGEMLI